MKPIPDDLAEDDPRVLEAARAYLADLEAGRKPDRQAYLARWPDLAGALAECFDGIELAQALRPAVAGPQPEYPADPLGDFQIVREIGRGGMGVVYEAVQLSLGRRVALKVLPFAAALNARDLQRFKTEAHAAAQLHHTNIVPVYAVGCERGVHFYAMQLIDGRPLDTVIRAWREETTRSPLSPRTGRGGGGEGGTGDTTGRLRAGPTAADRRVPPGGSLRSLRGRESFRTAARIAAQAADALEYAHEAGVIHRDVKPANLLLDAKGTVWVTDFGLAQVTSDVSLTKTGEMVGTLRYTSPEQASGQRVLIDHRADVYSLGATLYEMLTLRSLFDGANRQALLYQILNDEPRPPRSLDRAIPPELETIVLKALAKAPAERYATAGAMAADLRRFLDERPILARRPSVVDRARKWMRRHPAVVGAAVLLLVFGTVGLAVTTALVAREQARTQKAYDRERQRAEEADERFRLARRAADDMIQMANQELADNPHLENLRKRLLLAALAYYQEFIELRREDPELTDTRDRVKQILNDLAVLQGAGQVFLLRDPAVLADLRASDEQRAQVSELTKGLDERRDDWFRDLLSLPPDERGQKLLEAARRTEAAVAVIFSKDELHRLRQIALQCQGPRAFRDPEITAALELTPEQKERIRSIEMKAFFGKGDPIRLGKRPESAFAQARKDAMEQIQAVFTNEQAKRWQTMTGEPFAGPLPPFFPGPPRPFRPPAPREDRNPK